MTIYFIDLKSYHKSWHHPVVDSMHKANSKRLFLKNYLPDDYAVEDYDNIGSGATKSWIRYLSPHLQGRKKILKINENNIESLCSTIDSSSERSICLISVLSHTYSLAKQVIKHIRQISNTSYIIIGGVHPTLNPKETFKDLRPDCLVIGEADHIINKIIEHCRKNTSFDLPGVIYSANNHTYWNYENTLPEANDIISDWKMHIEASDGIARYTPYYTGCRDCLYRCNFCAIVPTNKYRALTPLNVYKDIYQLKEILKNNDYNERSLYVIFEDPTFLSNKDRVYKLLRAISDLNINWEIRTRIEKPTSETQSLFRNMKEVGCRSVFFGVECMNQAVLNAANKRIKVEYVEQFIRSARIAGLLVNVGFILGLPGQTKAIAENDHNLMIRWIKNNLIAVPEYYLLNLYPGTEFRNNSYKYGIRILNTKPEDVENNIVHETEELTRSEMLTLFKIGCSRIVDAY